MTTPTAFDSLAAPSDPTQGLEGLCRLLEGLGFRMRWACEGLREEDCTAVPIEGSWSIGEQLSHLVALTGFGREALENGTAEWGGNAEEDRHPLAYRKALDHISAILTILREDPSRLAKTQLTAGNGAHVFPAAYLCNGPWADALHHVGQIVLLRKLTGNPAPSAQPFLGQPPSEG